MFGFEETPLPKPKSRQRRVTLKTPSEDEPGDKENDKPSTSAASFTDTCLVTRTKQPAIQQEEPVFEIAVRHFFADLAFSSMFDLCTIMWRYKPSHNYTMQQSTFILIQVHVYVLYSRGQMIP